jgi:hypothetical protein
MKLPVTVPKKKEYEAAKLVRYGSLTEITAGTHLRGMMDGKAATTKTG